MNCTNTQDQTKRKAIIAAIGCFALFVFFLILFLVSTGTWAVIWIILFVMFLVAALVFAVLAFTMTKTRYEK